MSAMLPMFLLLTLIGSPRRVAAQFNTPIVWFAPNLAGTTVHTGAAITDTVHWCSGVPLQSSTASVTQNGTPLSFVYISTDHNGCGTYYAHALLTITPVLGTNTVVGSIKNTSGVQGSRTMVFTYDTSQVWVTPDGQGATRPFGSSAADTFVVHNFTNGAITYNLTTTCTNAASLNCSAPSSVWVGLQDSATVVVSYQTRGYNTTDTVTVLASTSDGKHYDTGSIIATASQNSTSVSFSANNEDNQQLGLCANTCFAAAVSHNTPSYRTLGIARFATLIYRGDLASAQPYVAADVSIPSIAPKYVRLMASVNGSPAQFINGQDTLYFSTAGWQAGKNYRIAGQLNLSALATNMYSLALTVSAVYTYGTTGHVETYTSPSSMKMMVVNWRTSTMLPAVGWWIAGVQQLYLQSDGTVLVVEGDGSGVYFNCTLYSSPCAGPSGDYTTLTSTGSGSSLQWIRAYHDSSKVYFDNVGHMIRAVDRWGNTSYVSWDVNNHVYAMQDPMTGNDYITYNTGSFTIGLPEPNLRSPYDRRLTTVTYNSASGQLTQITDPDGLSTNFSYDASGRLSTVQDRLGSTTTYYYGGNSWTLDSIASPAVTIDGQSQPQSPVVRMRSWQRAGAPTALTDSGSNLAAAAKTDTIRAFVIGPLHDTTTFTVDRWGQPLVSVDPQGDTTTIFRSGIFATSVTNPLGQTSTYQYNPRGLIINSSPYGQPTTWFSYDSWGMVDTVRGGNAPTVTKSFDAIHRTITTTVGGTYTSTDSLDSYGRIFYSQDPAGHKTRYHFDAIFGNPDSTLADAGQWGKVVMDSYGRDSLITASSQVGVVRYAYDVLGRDSLKYDGVHANPIMYKYNAVYLTHVVDPMSQVYKRDVNALGWASTIYDPADTINLKVTYKYDLEGRPTTSINRRGQSVTQQWDKLGRLTSKRDGTTADSLWYPNLRTVIDSNAVAFDTLKVGNNGSDTVVTRIAGQWFKTVHSATGGTADTTVLTSSIGQLQNRMAFYSASRGVLDSMNIGGAIYKFGYTNELLPDTILYPTFTRIDSVTTTHGLYSRSYSSANLDSAFARSYDYDSLGRITSEQSLLTGSSIHFQQRQYTYTGTGALSSYVRARSSAVQCVPTYGCFGGDTYTDFSTTYGYDAAENLKSDGSISATFDTGDRLRSWGGASYTFDNDGNRLTKGDTAYTWSASGRLLKVKHGTDADSVEYRYDSNGALVQRKTNGVTDRYFVWDRGRLILLLDGTGSKIAEYAYQPNGEPLSITPTGHSNEIYLTDGRGNVVGVTDGTGDLLQQNYYGPWGDLETQYGSGLDTTRLGWKGLIWEGGLTKLYYVNNRWYDPASRSFLSDDPSGIEGGLNTYSYVGNDPVNGNDPSGLDPCTAAESAQGGITITVGGNVGCVTAQSVQQSAFDAVAELGPLFLELDKGLGIPDPHTGLAPAVYVSVHAPLRMLPVYVWAGADAPMHQQSVDLMDAAIFLDGMTLGRNKGIGRCAAFVCDALHVGGGLVDMSGKPSSHEAADYGPFLVRHGWVPIRSGHTAAGGPLADYTPELGDVVVFDRAPGHSAGHIQFWTGDQWRSDFKQGTQFIPTQGINWGYTIYRRR